MNNERVIKLKLRKPLALLLATMLTFSTTVPVFAVEEGIQQTQSEDAEKIREEYIKIIDSHLATAKGDPDFAIKLINKSVSANELNIDGFTGLIDKIQQYYVIDKDANQYVTTYEELEQRDPNAPANAEAIDPITLTPDMNSAEGGHFGAVQNALTGKRDLLTDTEIAYRSNEVNQGNFKTKLDYVKGKVSEYAGKYKTKYESEVKIVGTDSTITNHKPVVGAEIKEDGSFYVGGFSDGNLNEYSVLADMLKVDLAGLETFTLLNTIATYGNETEKESAKQILTEFSKTLEEYYGTFNSSVEKKGADYAANPVQKKAPNTFMYQESLASADIGTVEKKIADGPLELLKKALTVNQVYYLKFISIAMKEKTETNGVVRDFKADVPTTLATTDKSIEKLNEETKKLNEDGIKSLEKSYGITVEYTKDGYGKNIKSANTVQKHLFASPLAYMSRVYSRDGLDDFIKYPVITDSYIKTNGDSMFANAFLPLELTIYGALDFQHIMESVNYTQGADDAAAKENLVTYLTNIRPGYVELAKTAYALANFYKTMGYPTRASNLETYTNSQLGLFRDVLGELGDNAPAIIDSNTELNIGDNILPETVKKVADEAKEDGINVNLEDLANSECYYELIAWTGAFTPFETNINNFVSNANCLSPDAISTYRERLGKLTPLYAAQGDRGTILAMHTGNTRQLNYITLRDFIARQGEDLVLFANRYTESEVYEAKVKGVIISQEQNSPTENEEGEAQAGAESPTLKINNGNKINTSNRTDNNAKFLGPVYVSSSDSEYATGLSKLIKKENNRNESELKLNAVQDANAKNDNLTQEQKDNQGLGQLQSTGSNEIASFMSKITPAHYYTNYTLMYNVLKDGGQNNSAIEPDMDRPLFMDFLGNIVTESGYVVVPAAANTTFYQDLEAHYPIYTAMFLNAYPEIYRDSTGNIELRGNDKGKFVLSVIADATKNVEGADSGSGNIYEKGTLKSNKKYKICFLKTTKDDNSTANEISSKLYVEFPHSKFTLSFKPDSAKNLQKEPLDEEDASVDLIDIMTSFIDMGPAYIKAGSKKTELAKVFTLANYERITIDTPNGGAEVALNGVSAIPSDASWNAVTTVLKNHYLNVKNQTSDGPDSILKINDRFLKIAAIIQNCSTDTEAMLLDNNFMRYEDMLKDNPIISALGNLLERMINGLYGLFSVNLMLYTPTISNIPILSKMHLYIRPITMALLAILITIVIFGILLSRLGSRENSNYDMVFSCIMIIILLLYNLNFHPTVTKFIYEEIPATIMGNKQYDYIAYKMEERYKQDNSQFFSDKKSEDEIDDNTPLIKIKELSETEVKDLRLGYNDDRLELNSIFYAPKYDNTYMNVIGTDIFLKGNSLYMTVEDLFDKSTVADIVNVDGTFSMEHKLYNEVESISYFTPYYNILESLVYTVNTYSEGCDTQVKLKNYSNNIKTSGRAASYFNSIFFIAPENVEQIKTSTKEQYERNIGDMIDADIFANKNLTGEQREEAIEKYKHQIEQTNTNIDVAFAYLLEGLGDLDDWLGLKRVLYLNETNNFPFAEENRMKTVLTDWYPSELRDIALGNYGNIFGEDVTEDEIKAFKSQIEWRLKQVNYAVKAYVMSELAPVADCFSDDTLLKLVALRATVEFNKQFSDIVGGEQFFPRTIEASGLDNKFTLMSSYIPRRKIFNASSTGLSYILAYEKGWPALALAFLDLLLRLVAYAIPIIAIGLMSLAPFFLLVAYALKRTQWVQYAFTCFTLTLLLSFARYINVITYVFADTHASSMGITGALIMNIILSILTIVFARLVIIITKHCIKRGFVVAGRSLSDKLYDFATGNFSRGDRYTSRFGFDRGYDSYARDHYGSSGYDRWDINSSYDPYDKYTPGNNYYGRGTRNTHFSDRRHLRTRSSRVSAFDYDDEE